MTRYDLGMSEQELDRTQPMPPMSPAERTQLWTLAPLPKSVVPTKTRSRFSRQRMILTALFLLFALSLGYANRHTSSTSRKPRKTPTPRLFSRAVAPTFVPVPHAPPVTYPETSRWKPTERTIVQPHAPIPDE